MEEGERGSTKNEMTRKSDIKIYFLCLCYETKSVKRLDSLNINSALRV